MKRFISYVRATRKELVLQRGLSVRTARDYFFTLLTMRVLFERGLISEGLDQSLRSCAQRLELLLGELPSYVQRAAGEDLISDLIPDDIVRMVSSDPLHIGWAYQFWNETERDESTWAVSRRGDIVSPHHSISAATQLFTEDYMASFLANQAFAGKVYNHRAIESGEFEVLDPACGTGHILVHALRACRNATSDRGVQSQTPHWYLTALYGCDIDFDAVELCRVVLLLEALKDPPTDVAHMWRILTLNIQALTSPLGTLDRSDPSLLMRRTYGCVLTNPPYIGRRKLTDEVRAFLDNEYPDSCMDLCSAFMQRCIELVTPDGALGLVTVDKWLRLRGYERLRIGGARFDGLYRMLSIDVLCELGPRAFASWSSLHDGVGITLLSARRQEPLPSHTFQFISCASEGRHSEKARILQEWQNSGVGASTVAQKSLLEKGRSTSFVVNHGIPESLSTSTITVAQKARVIVGLQTSDDRRFVRYVWSVPPDRDRWLVHSKGGGYGRWFGLNRFLLDWGGGKSTFEKDPKSGMRVEKWFDQEGWTYTWFANGSLGLRKKELGWSFGRAAASGFFCDDARVVGFLNSRAASLAVRRIGGKAQLPEGIVRALPIPARLGELDLWLVLAAVEIKRVIAERDLTECSFQSSALFDPYAVLSLQALLLCVEGAIEAQVCELLSLSAAEHLSLDSAMGRPVGWNTRSSDACDESMWSSIPQTFHYLRPLLNSGVQSNVPGPSSFDCVREYLEGSRKVFVPARALPTTSFLEEVSRASGGHPIDVAEGLRKLAPYNRRVKDEIEGTALRDRVMEEVLNMLGHQWWATTKRYEPSRHAIYTAEELAKAISCKLSNRDCDLLLEGGLRGWISTRMELWQARRFYNAPLVVRYHRRGCGEAIFSHIWSAECSARQNRKADIAV